MLEIAETIGKQAAGGLGGLRLVDDVVGRGDSQTDKLDGIGHLFLLATLGGYIGRNTPTSGIIRHSLGHERVTADRGYKREKNIRWLRIK
jgi:hypothetical protein